MFALTKTCIYAHFLAPAGLGWTNFHLPWPRDKKKKNDKPGPNAASGKRRQNVTDVPSGNRSIECDRIRFSNSELAGTWGSVTLAFGSALLLRLGLRTQELLTRKESELRAISFFEWFGVNWYDSIDMPGAKTFFLSKELTVLDKAFLGFTESSAEGWVSGCKEYQVGGGITLAVLIIGYVLVPGFVMYKFTKMYLEYKPNPNHKDLVVRLFDRGKNDTERSRVDAVIVNQPWPGTLPAVQPTSPIFDQRTGAFFVPILSPDQRAGPFFVPVLSPAPSHRHVISAVQPPVEFVRTVPSFSVTGSCFGMEPHGGGLNASVDSAKESMSIAANTSAAKESINARVDAAKESMSIDALVDAAKESIVARVKKATVDKLTGGEKLQGEWKANPDKDSQTYWALTKDLYQEHHGRCSWYIFWVMLVTGLTAIFIKCMLPNVDV